MEETESLTVGRFLLHAEDNNNEQEMPLSGYDPHSAAAFQSHNGSGTVDPFFTTPPSQRLNHASDKRKNFSLSKHVTKFHNAVASFDFDTTNQTRLELRQESSLQRQQSALNKDNAALHTDLDSELLMNVPDNSTPKFNLEEKTSSNKKDKEKVKEPFNPPNSQP